MIRAPQLAEDELCSELYPLYASLNVPIISKEVEEVNLYDDDTWQFSSRATVKRFQMGHF